jgi:hypothetical protein
MKKFLFTLAALLMASSAFAANYLYIDDIELTQEFVQQTSNKARRIQVPVKCHLEQWTNAWDVTFNYGDITCRGAVVDETTGLLICPDMELTGMNKGGSTIKVTPSLNANEAADHFIAAQTVGGYYYPEGSDPDEDDPVLYGAIKWAPGEYECMFMLELQIPLNFAGGDIISVTEMASGEDKRPGVETVTLEPYTHVTHVTVKADAQPVAAPTITFSGEETTQMTVTVTSEDADATLIVNGEAVEGNPYTYTVDRPDVYTAGTVAVTAQAKKGDVLSEEVTEEKAWVVKELLPFDATATVTLDGDVFTLYYKIGGTYDIDQNPVVNATVTVDGETVDYTFNWTDALLPDGSPEGGKTATYNHSRLTTVGEHNVVVTLSVGPGTGYTGQTATDSETLTYTIQPKLAGEIVFGEVDPNTGKMTVTYTGDEEGVWLTVTVNGKEVTVGEDGTIQLEEGQNVVEAYANALGYEYNYLHNSTTVTWTKPVVPEATMPVINFSEDGSGVMITIENYTEYTISVNDEVVKVYPTRAEEDNYYYVEKEYDVVKNIHVYAKNAPQGYTPAENEDNFELAAKEKEQTKKPSVTYRYENGKLTVWAYGSEDDAVYTLYCDGVEYTGEMPITYDIYAGYGPHIWTATAIAPNKTVSDVSDPVEITIPKETKYYQTPAPVIGEPVVTAENVTFTVTGEGTVTVTVTTSEGTKTYTGEEGSVTVVLPRGEEYDLAIVNATAKANVVPDGFDAVAPGRVGPKDIDIPALEYSAKPVINQTPGKSEWDEEGNQTVDGHVVTVTFEAVQGAEVYYRIDGKGEFVKWDGTPIYFRDNGDYTIEAYAVEPGKMPSEVVPQSIHVTEATSVNGLVNGKTVAGVRYFNMAGQEMQEANGVTIVVTTYTDGTTSAVKVIK